MLFNPLLYRLSYQAKNEIIAELFLGLGNAENRVRNWASCVDPISVARKPSVLWACGGGWGAKGRGIKSCAVTLYVAVIIHSQRNSIDEEDDF